MSRLSSGDWIKAALDALAEDGLGAVAVEPLARRLGVTKGSFYWHFKDRQSLLAALLEDWERRETELVIEWLQTFPSGRERLTRLLRRALEDRASSQHYLALTSAAGEPLISAALQRVSARRLDYLRECYDDMGVPQARLRAHAAYAAYIGTIHLARELVRFPEYYAEHLITMLVPE